MPVIITITNDSSLIDNSEIVYNYSEYDRVLKNVFKDEYEVFYSGQNKGIIDYQLTNAIQNNDLFKVYYREKKNIPYKYLGFTYISNICQDRKIPININSNPNERLQIHLVINNIYNIAVPEHNIIGSGKFKKDVLIHSGLRDINDNSIIPHNRNTNIGFYYYETF
mgnify:CR=1 FL=1